MYLFFIYKHALVVHIFLSQNCLKSKVYQNVFTSYIYTHTWNYQNGHTWKPWIIKKTCRKKHFVIIYDIRYHKICNNYTRCFIHFYNINVFYYDVSFSFSFVVVVVLIVVEFAVLLHVSHVLYNLLIFLTICIIIKK